MEHLMERKVFHNDRQTYVLEGGEMLHSEVVVVRPVQQEKSIQTEDLCRRELQGLAD